MSRSSTEPILSLPENRFALTAVEAWAHSRKVPAPVFLYGPSGVGKSHLARHGLRILAVDNDSLRVVHQDADELAAEFAAASTRKGIPRFQAQLRDLDCFILEDVHTLEGRPETQQQVLAAIDHLSAHQCRLLWTSRKSPGELQNVSPKLTDRFHQGVTSLVRLPGLESRRLLVGHLAASRGMVLPTGADALIARRMPVSPRELLGLIHQIETRSRGQGKTLDLALIRQVLGGTLPPRTLKMEEIARAVARHFHVTVADLKSPERSRHLMLPRHCAIHLSRELTEEGLVSIGEYFHRNHSTVVHACDRIRDQSADDPELRAHLAQLRRSLGAQPVA